MNIGFEAIGFSGIGEAPEDRWIVGGSAEMSIDWIVSLCAASHDYITRPGDTPPDTTFIGALQKAFRIDRSVIGPNRLGEEFTEGFGEVTLNNLEHDYDFLQIDHTAQGQRVAIRMGDRRMPYATWRVVLVGYMTDYNVDLGKITFRLRDAGHKLDVPLSPNVYAGTGGTEGTADLAGKRKPRWFGWNLNVSPPLVIPNYLAYQLHDGPIHQVIAVYVRGVALTFEADYGSVSAMNAATLAVGEFASCLAEGWVRIGALSESEMGQVTVDFAGDKTGGVFVETASAIVRRMLKVTTIVDPDDLVTTSFDDLHAAQPAPVGIGIGAGDDSTVAQVAGRLMAGIAGWIGARRNGKFEVSRLEAPAGSPVGLYSPLNVRDVSSMPLPADISPPPWRARVGYARNWTVNQSDIAGSVSDARRAFLAEDVRFAVAENATVRADFPPGREFTKADTFFRDEADAQAEAARLGALYWVPRALYVFRLCEPLFIHELNQVVNLQFPRFDLAGGKLLRIVKLSEDDADGVEITAFG